MRALARARIQWTDGRIIKLPQETDLEYAMFGLTPEQVGVQSWSESAPGDLRMVRPPGIKIALLEFEISTARSCDIWKACSAIGRCQHWSILEWAMLNPELLRKFFVRMAEGGGVSAILYKSV